MVHTTESLSWYNRSHQRSNQNIEGFNKSKNRKAAVAVNYGKVTCLTWLILSATLEKETMNRAWALFEGETDWKQKSKSCRKRDFLIGRLVKQHKFGNLGDDEYFDGNICSSNLSIYIKKAYLSFLS